MSRCGNVSEVNILDDFIGKTFSEIKVINHDELHFKLPSGETYIFYHIQQCCEYVGIDDICGDLKDLIGSPITMAEEVIHESVAIDCEDEDYEKYRYDYKTYTFYKFATVKGYVTVRWYGASNGEYSETVDFRKEK